MTVTVAMPYYGCPDLVERAVRCVLAQTHRDLRVLVIGDGEDPPLSNVMDSRLEVYRLPENHGAYFALQLALRATPDAWFAPFGADDTADPEHIENLLRVAAKDNVEAVYAGSVWWGTGYERQRDAAYEVGAYTPSRLLSFGGYNPAERIAQDTLMIHLLRISGTFSYTRQPTYHRVKRPGSLTTATETGLNSPARMAVRQRNLKTYHRCRKLGEPRLMREYREELVPRNVRIALDTHVAILRERLGAKVAA